MEQTGLTEVSLGQVMKKAESNEQWFLALVDDVDGTLQGAGWTLSATDRENLDWMIRGAVKNLARGPGGPLKPWP